MIEKREVAAVCGQGINDSSTDYRISSSKMISFINFNSL